MIDALRVENLTITVPSGDGAVEAVDNISFSIRSGTKVALVGESGSGKSLTAYSIMRMIENPVRVQTGDIWLGNREISSLTDKEFRVIRGAEIAMIYQDPMSTLNPIMRIGRQIIESIQLYSNMNTKLARIRALELLNDVGILDPERRLNSYPFELSGGMLQRLVIAMALSGSPKLLIADEATTALDVTTQARVLDLLDKLAVERNLSVLLITHDLGVAAQFADEVIVMYAGRIVEKGSVRQVFTRPMHPYTQALLESRCDVSVDFSQPIKSIPGQPPKPARRVDKCSFAARCSFVRESCLSNSPALIDYGLTSAACFHSEEIASLKEVI
jgi:oligopeptide/dipeptide ABC transporter ATP-binding protein